MTKFAIVRDHKGLIRDLNSKAILNVDDQSLVEHRKNKNVLKTLIENSNKIEKMENDIKQILEIMLQLKDNNKV
jgi:hypothetical protein